MAHSKMKKEARKKMLGELKGMMKDDMHHSMKDKMKGMKKIVVSSDSQKGLEEGLSKAQKILKHKDGMMGDKYKDGGKKDVKARTTEAPDSLGKGKAEYRGWKEDPKPYDRKKPEYLDHRALKPERLAGKYADGGMTESSDKTSEKKKSYRRLRDLESRIISKRKALSGRKIAKK